MTNAFHIRESNSRNVKRSQQTFTEGKKKEYKQAWQYLKARELSRLLDSFGTRK